MLEASKCRKECLFVDLIAFSCWLSDATRLISAIKRNIYATNKSDSSRGSSTRTTKSVELVARMFHDLFVYLQALQQQQKLRISTVRKFERKSKIETIRKRRRQSLETIKNLLCR